jgi:hypothetical protein
MRYYCIYMLSALAAVLLCSLAKSPSSSWEDKRTKHSWKTVPKNWEKLGHPPLNTTIDLYISLKPHSENALIDVLYNVSTPDHPEHVLHSFPHPWTHMYHCSDADTANTSPRSRSLSLSLHIQRRLNLLTPGSSTTTYPPRLSRHKVATH